MESNSLLRNRANINWDEGDRKPSVSWESFYEPSNKASYQEISVVPTFAEIVSAETLFLKRNKKYGAFRDPIDYIETHFGLFYEDFFRPFKSGVQDFLKNKTEYLIGEKVAPKGNIRLHRDVVYDPRFEPRLVLGGRFGRKHGVEYLQINLPDSIQLPPGSLLILSTDDFTSAYVATVHSNRNDALLKEGILEISWEHESPSGSSRFRFDMLESNFFQSHRHTLEVLQMMKPNELPFQKYLVNCCPHVGPPEYLKIYRDDVLIKEGYCLKPLDSKTWPEARELHLNENQFQALMSCLTKELAIVQGPPGTGKTFLALQLMEVILRNLEMWNPRGQQAAPILLACFTNHALDQFLEGVLNIYRKIGLRPRLIRVGGGSHSKSLEQYNIGKINWNQRNLAIRNSHIVGMTTTGAAKYGDLLTHASPRIVIVEEAAEVLEAHIIPCLLPYCQHLILIGDHQQLQPGINVQELAYKYHLDVSLFERMVNNKLQLCTLNVQHRMRPEISELIADIIYKDLQDGPQVFQYPNVVGIQANVYFVTHQKFESSAPGSWSKVNTFEAEFTMSFCNYMMQQGYTPEQITILATYKGQVELLRKCARKHELCKKVEVTTVDGFQGKESDIILLSLVRSNDKAQIGFLKKDNRICVALSRAKYGLFMVGNMKQLASGSYTWKKIKNKLEQKGAIGRFLPIECKTHRSSRMIQTPEDFKQLAPDGGCCLPCDLKLNCGHRCQATCHNTNHDNYKCRFVCKKTCVRGHPCENLCCEPCSVCMLLLVNPFPCKHEVSVHCCLVKNGCPRCRAREIFVIMLLGVIFAVLAFDYIRKRL